jgi:hypothetical protein
MGYYKNLEIALQVEEPDRYPTRRDSRKRETYQKPKSVWVFFARDISLMVVGYFCAFGLGVVLGYVIGGGLNG